jgi:ribosomal protein S18 acetylase RimI-like enzyme
MNHRIYDRTRDRAAVQRIFREVGWSKEGEEEKIDLFMDAGRTLIADLDGDPVSVVSTAPGDIRYMRESLPLCVITSACTSRRARRQGLAKRLTAQAIAAAAMDGALVAALGTFDLGYYEQIGFGTLPYEHIVSFDPQHLSVAAKARVPRPLGLDNWQAVHAALLARVRGHGSCSAYPPGLIRAEILASDNGFGMGYGDGPGGALAHFVWFTAPNPISGPYEVKWLVYQTPAQFLELMALIGSLGDQVRGIVMHEPAGIQLQDFLRWPIRHREMSEGSRYESAMRALADGQVRICDLPGCLERTHLPSGDVRFNLRLCDPVEWLLDTGTPWRGVAGEYVVSLGASSGAERGADASLPTLTATVNAWTRLWLGVRPATGLAITDALSGPVELLQRLDEVLRLPEPKPDWDF